MAIRWYRSDTIYFCACGMYIARYEKKKDIEMTATMYQEKAKKYACCMPLENVESAHL